MRHRRLALALLCWMLAVPAGRGAQPAPDEDEGIAALLQALETCLESRNPTCYTALTSTVTKGTDALLFAMDVVQPETTAATVKERDRSPLAGFDPGTGYRLMVDVLIERGRAGSVATWRLDVARPDASRNWRIVTQQKLTSVEGLYRLALDVQTPYTVKGLTVQAEDFRLELPKGIAFTASTDFGPTAFVLLGDGMMHFTPKPPAERGQVRIFCGEEEIHVRFTQAFIRVAAPDFMSALTPRARVSSRDVRRAAEVFEDFVGLSFSLDLADLSPHTWSLIPPYGDFIAEVRTRGLGTLTYARSMGDPEDVTLFERSRRRTIAIYASEQKLAVRGPTYSEVDLADYDVVEQQVDATFDPNREVIEGRTTLRLRARSYALSTVNLRLADTLAVRSVSAEGLGRLLALRVKGQHSVIANLPQPISRGEELVLTVSYGGRLQSQGSDREVIAPQSAPQLHPEVPVIEPERRLLYSNRSYWYPQAPVSDYARSVLRLTVPAGWAAVATGVPAAGSPVALAATETLPARTLYLFSSNEPVRYFSVVLSRLSPAGNTRFELTKAAQAERAAQIEALGRTPLVPLNDGVAIDAMANPRQVRRGPVILAQAARIMGFYATTIADIPYPRLTLALVDADLPGGHSPAYLALLHQPLPTTPYTWRNDPVNFDDFPSFFLAHELAHQYWGQAVGWKNYHEQWISEGFAQYFAVLWAERHERPDALASVLRQMTRSAIEHDDQGPINLGYRLGHIEGDSRPFRAIVYNKGALVLHMLRRTLGDEKFFDGLRRFYFASRFRRVGTSDFQRAMEAVAGRPLDDFFNRWIHGTGIPVVRWEARIVDGRPNESRASARSLATGAGGSFVELRFRQSAPAAELPVTVTIQYADRTTEDHLVVLDGPTIERRIATRPGVREVEVNRDGAALARFVRP